MRLKIITVDTHLEREDCDYITLSIADAANGSFSGSYGIKKGHARAAFCLGDGRLTAQRRSEVIFSAETSSGFATVKDNVVTVTVDSIKESF